MAPGAYYLDDDGRLHPVNVEDYYSDHDALTDDLAEALQAPGGGTNSDIQQLVDYQRLQHARKTDEAAPVNIAPPSVSAHPDPKLGDSATCVAGGPTNEVIRWDGSPDESRNAIISFGMPQRSISTDGTVVAASGAPITRAFADITYGARNFTKTVRVDISKGGSVCVQASVVFVNVGLELSGANTGSIILGASMGFGSVDNNLLVTRTVYFDTALTAGSSTAVTQIPAGAKQLLPIQRAVSRTGTTLTAVPFCVEFFDASGTVVATLFGGDTVYSFMESPMPIPDDAVTFQVTNCGAANSIPSMRFIFALKL